MSSLSYNNMVMVPKLVVLGESVTATEQLIWACRPRRVSPLLFSVVDRMLHEDNRMNSTPSLASSSSSFMRPPSSRSVTTSVYTTQFDEDEDPWGDFPSTDKATTSKPSTLNDPYRGKKEGEVSDVAFGKLKLYLTLTIKSFYAFVSKPILTRSYHTA